MADLEEIIVTGRRRRRPGDFGFGRDEQFDDRQELGTRDTSPFEFEREFDTRDDARFSFEEGDEEETDAARKAAVLLTATQAQEAMKPLTEIKVVAKRAVKQPPKKIGVTTRDLFKGPQLRALEASVEAKLRAAKFGPFEEIKVVAKRIPKGSFLPFGGPIIFAADIIGQITNVISQRRLDEVGYLATRTVKPKPDTPVKTISPEIIDEIVVTAKRPRAKRPDILRDFSTRDIDFFDSGAGFPSQKPTAVKFAVKSPKRIPKPKLPFDLDPFTFTRTNIRPGERGSPSAQPRTGPRSTLLNIPKRTTPGDLTRFNPQVIGLPITASSPQLAGGSCGPCPKPKEKKRKKCYKGLMKQGRFARNDKFTKWVEINCRTKREI